jgi:hypothetical protein
LVTSRCKLREISPGATGHDERTKSISASPAKVGRKTIRSGWSGTALAPWIVGDASGFVLGAAPGTDKDLAKYAQLGDINSDFVVVTHLKSSTEPWALEPRLIRAIDGKCVGALAVSFPMSEPEEGLLGLARRLLALLAQEAGVEPRPILGRLPSPGGAALRRLPAGSPAAPSCPLWRYGWRADALPQRL